MPNENTPFLFYLVYNNNLFHRQHTQSSDCRFPAIRGKKGRIFAVLLTISRTNKIPTNSPTFAIAPLRRF